MADGLQGTDFYGFVGRQDAGDKANQSRKHQGTQHQPGWDDGDGRTGCPIPAHDAGQVYVLAKGCHDRGQVVQNETDQQADKHAQHAANKPNAGTFHQEHCY